ncbi:tRNA (guanosine(37)-N1)-methyltransferase TrmD [Candidatus Saccharibacteria bacterium]|nr:tRNA (guanosine(37)-N1)-methyltransferase TrmD [Candidatus Saccharibacteria bacterium]MBQ3469353.1 tRNA (guanosine(37)-N1)-methyltransferase TrmD [Candidatus Saccharibacteria bacterium]
MPKVKFTIITLFEDAIKPYLNTSMMWKAQDRGIVEFDFVNLRDFGLGPHKSVDDTPYGGGDGMVMRVEPIYAAIEQTIKKAEEAGGEKPEVILPTPDGMLWTEDLARQFAGVETPDASVDAVEESIRGKATGTIREDSFKHYIIFCPHYEGYDARILDLVDHKICLGPYILTGGELPALIIIDSIVRLLPGVLGGTTSADLESFSNGDNIEAPQFTKPKEFRGKKVPEVLLSGNHKKVAEWRKNQEKSFKGIDK